MRKPRDFDSELNVLTYKANLLKARKVQQLGKLVIATVADVLDIDALASALLVILENKEGSKKEAWRNRGAALFSGQSRKAGGGTPTDTEFDQAHQSHDAPH